MSLHRREFLKLAGSSALATGIVPGARLAFGAPPQGAHETLVIVFLRGGCDGLNLVPPISGNDRTDYEISRPDLKIPVSGHAAALPLVNSATASGSFGLHPRATALHALYQQGALGIVVGAGMPAPALTRSHFDAQQWMELGTPGTTGGGGGGWLTRHLLSAGLPGQVDIPALSAGSITATSLIASTESITMGNGKQFRINSTAWSWQSNERAPGDTPSFRGMVERMPDLWAGNSALHAAGQQALDAMAVIRPIDFDAPPGPGANYPSGTFADQLKMIAQLRKAGLGLRVATIDHGGWDTHNSQGVATSTYDPFGNMVESLSESLAAFHTDLGGHAVRTTVIVMSEFGRRLRQNGSVGTDHGYANVMLALGGGVNGGQVHGRQAFAGLSGQALFEGEDVMVTVDFRRVLAEALVRRTGNTNIGQVFPGYSGYTPLGVFKGSDNPGSDGLFTDGFD